MFWPLGFLADNIFQLKKIADSWIDGWRSGMELSGSPLDA